MASLTSRPVYSRGTANSIHRTGGRMGPEPVWTFRRRGTPYVHSHGHRYTLSCMTTEIPYRVCPPVYLIAYAHPHTLPRMPIHIPYRVCPLVSPKCKESSLQRRHLWVSEGRRKWAVPKRLLGSLPTSIRCQNYCASVATLFSKQSLQGRIFRNSACNKE